MMIKANKNSEPSTLPDKFGQIWHSCDIGFAGPSKAIGGNKYTLLLIDKRTQFKKIYGLKNLTDSLLLNAFQTFIVDFEGRIEEIRTDFDDKIIGSGRIRKLLSSNRIKIYAAPPRRQKQNGLVKRHWQTIVSMTRSWLKSSLLPSAFWWYGIKRAVEVSNAIFPQQFHINKDNHKSSF